jgi:hypothetical protein
LRSKRDQDKRDDSMRCDSLGRRVPSRRGEVAESPLSGLKCDVGFARAPVQAPRICANRVVLRNFLQLAV